MIVDDSSTMRNILRSVLQDDPEIELVAQAVNGKLALPRIKHYKPEIMILDNEMPEMTGIEMLKEMKSESIDSGVIMFSSHTVEGARVTVEALALGALDFVTKPSPSDGDPQEYIKRKLIARLKTLARQRRPEEMTKVVSEKKAFIYDRPLQARYGKYEICAIGISTGGPAALRELIPKISPDIRGSVLIVQHMPPIFTRQMADSLNQLSRLGVVEAADGMKVERGKVYIAPGGLQMKLESRGGALFLRTPDEPPEANCRPSVNVLFRSVAEAAGDRSLAIIMTGMGNDGYEGMKKLKEKGSYLIAQSQNSCLVFGMPAQVTKEGIVHESLDLSALGERITQLLGTTG